ncbi:MAG: TetR/AcrR family transcriptional regulator [Anaerolineaceae bacterium]|nr:TetR/AcrR family transcriptional regulator [Anaerolineaceae bacterium]
MRNTEKDAAEMAERRETILDAGFKLFAEKTINPVSMNDVAKAAGVGIATLYRYYSTKQELVLAISTRVWEKYIAENSRQRAALVSKGMNAGQEFEFFLDSFIDVYRNHADILRFNQFFNVYVANEEVLPEILKPYLAIISGLAEQFHAMYERAKLDHSLRTDFPEKQMFSATLHIMLAAVTRYAVGLVYQPGPESDPESELLLLRDILLQRFVV